MGCGPPGDGVNLLIRMEIHTVQELHPDFRDEVPALAQVQNEQT